MDLGRPDYDAALAPWPVHRAHVVRDTDTDELIEVKGPNDRDVDAALAAGKLAPVIPADEPCFLIRGQDVAAPDTVRAYAHLAAGYDVDPGLVAQVLARADTIEAWQMARGEASVPDLPTRVPRWPARSSYPDPLRADVDDLPPDHRNALVCLGLLRRALDGLTLPPTPGGAEPVPVGAMFVEAFGAVESSVRHHAAMAVAGMLPEEPGA